MCLGSYYRGIVLIHSLSDQTVLRGQVHIQKVRLVAVLRHFLLIICAPIFLFVPAPSLAHAGLGRADQSQADSTEGHAHRTGIEGSTVVQCDIDQHTWKER